jgi:hypothetical protein
MLLNNADYGWGPAQITGYSGALEFPSHFSAEAADLISKLLTPDPVHVRVCVCALVWARCARLCL